MYHLHSSQQLGKADIIILILLMRKIKFWEVKQHDQEIAFKEWKWDFNSGLSESTCFTPCHATSDEGKYIYKLVRTGTLTSIYLSTYLIWYIHGHVPANTNTHTAIEENNCMSTNYQDKIVMDAINTADV